MVQIRKLESAEESERKRKRNTLILSILMIGILVFSTAGYFTFKGSEETTNNNQKVQNIGNEWILNYGGQTIRLSSGPENAENVTILTSKSLQDFSGKTVYVSASDAEFYELYSSLGGYADRMQEACYGKCEKNLPEKDCNETMIVVKSLNESDKNARGKIYEGDNCVFIEGGLKEIDAFIYKIFEVN
jgi:hypothetical protein